jgi:hypothetical protein
MNFSFRRFGDCLVIIWRSIEQVHPRHVREAMAPGFAWLFDVPSIAPEPIALLVSVNLP